MQKKLPYLVKINSLLKMHRGGQLPSYELAYETWGQLSTNKDNVILLFTGLSPDAHAASSPLNPASGWWEDMIGPNKALDTNHFFIICFNSLGSCKGSTGPASINPMTKEPYRLTFPDLSIEDIAQAIDIALMQLGIEQIHTIVGPSMGGMVALAYLQQFPGKATHLIHLSSAAHALPFSIAIRSLQREAICSDPNWQQGNYTNDKLPTQGMKLARKLGMLSYRSAPEWKTRFGRERITLSTTIHPHPFTQEFQVESYLEAHAEKFIHQFDPNCYLYLSRAMDWFDMNDYGNSVERALSQIQLEKALIVGVNSDLLFPLEQQQQIADGLKQGNIDVDFQALDCIHGHDSFLVDAESFSNNMKAFFTSL